MENKHQIIKTLVGSRAHGLFTNKSDFDYRGVHIIPTKDLISLNYKYKPESWVLGETEDQTSYELSNFINLAIQGHPNVLEMFMCHNLVKPEAGSYPESRTGCELLKLFDYIWDPQKAYTSFMNYANNRRKHMLKLGEDNKVAIKSAYCHIRVLVNLTILLKEYQFPIELDAWEKEQLAEIKQGKWNYGQVINLGEELMEDAQGALEECKQVPDLEKVHKFLIDTRKKYWE